MKKNDKIKVSILLVFCILLCFALFFRPDFSVKEGVSGTSLNYSLSITNGSMQGNTYGTDWGTKDGINYAWGGTLTAPSLTVYGNTLPTYCWMKVLPNTGYKYGSTTGGTYSSNIYTSQNFSANASGTLNFVGNVGTITVYTLSQGTVSPTSFTQTVGAAGTAITATPDAGYHFSTWSVTTNSSYITVASPSSATTTITATTAMPDGGAADINGVFAANIGTVSVVSGGGGTVSPSSFSKSYGAVGTTITATPSAGYRFLGWTATTNPSYVIIANASSATTTVTTSASMPNGGSATITAYFVKTWIVGTHLTGGGGSVTPTSITVDDESSATFSVTVNSGYRASITNATPTLLYAGSGQTITTGSINADTIVSIDFYPNTYTLTVNNGSGSGTYDYGINATITANSKTGYHFDHWEGDTSGIGNVNSSSTTILMDADKTVNAVFVNTPPTAYNGSITTNEDTAKGFTLTGYDPEGYTLSYDITTGPSHGTLSGTPPNLTYAPNANFYGTDSFTFEVADIDTSSGDATISITVNAVNDPPTNIQLSNNSISENNAINTVIGALTSTDVDSSSFTYTLVSGDTTAFNISGSNLRANIVYDYETKNSYSVVIRTDDGSGGTFDKSFTININNVNETPTNITLSASSIPENSAVNTVIGTLSTTDPDSGDTFTYTISGTDASSFNISGSSLRTSSVFDFETKSSYSITIRTTDQGGLYYEKAFTITVTNVNETPTNITLSASSIAENNIVNAVIGTLSTTDPDSGNTFTYTISGTDAASFNISGSSLRASVIFDFETKSSYSITITTTDQGGLAYAKAFTITVTNVNEAPTDISLSASTIPENSAVNTVIGTLSTTDPDSGNTFTYTIVAGGDGTSFNILGTSLRNSSVFDFETKNSYSVTIRTTDQGGLTFDKTFTITVTNVNEAPTDITLSANTIPENSAINTVIGALTSTDVDSSSFTYTLVSGDTTAFNISGSNLRANVVYDYETKNSYSITIRTSDGSLTFDKTFTITVTNVNEAPTGITLSSSSIPENSAIGTTIGTLSSTDPDAGNTFTYTIVTGGDGASFSISGTSLKSAAVFNYEVKSSYSVTIRTTDQGGLTFDKAFTITVTNVNDAPSDITLSSNSIIENKAAGTSIGTFSSTDEDNTTGFVYTIVGGADATSFSISGSNLLSAAVFDYETKNSYSITIRTTDTGGAYYEKAFTISIVNDTEEYTFNVVNAGTSNSSYYSTTLGPSGAYGSGTITYSGGNNTYDYNEQAVITITPAAGCFVYGIAYADNPSVRIYSAGGVVRNGGFKGSYTFTTNVTANKTILVYFQKIGDLKLNGVSNLDDAIIIGAKWQDASYYTLNAEGQHSVDSGGTSWEYFNSTLGYICPDINYDTHANDFDASLVMQYFEN